MTTLQHLNREILGCHACSRLVEWREQVAMEKRAAFREETYWGRPVPSFGDPGARILIVGLAPAAHGANRTGRMFTGDRSGEWLFRALHRTGFGSGPVSECRDDGLTLIDAWLTGAVHCAPPDNRPTPNERRQCQGYLERELTLLLPQLRGIVALGSFAWNQLYRASAALGLHVPRPRPRFGHRAEAPLLAEASDPIRGNVPVIGSYHPSQQNTFTGRLTESMFDSVWTRARELADG